MELFSGYESLSEAFRKRGHKCFTIDWDEKFPSSLHKDISQLQMEDIPEEFRHPDVIFVGLDCTTYSIASVSHHRKQEADGNLAPVSEKAKFTDNMAVHVKELIKELNPKIQIWENPIGGLRKMWFMRDLEFRNTTSYCQYGFKYRKGTDFFSNVWLGLKTPCKNGSPCHEPAPRGSKTGLQGIKDKSLRSCYPPLLCDDIAEKCEKIIDGRSINT